MSEILSTAEVAQVLGVSEASVRRWSDRGVLPVERVGERGERRFQRKDVERFAASSRPARPLRTPAGRASGSVLVGGLELEPFTHVAILYDSDEARLRLAVPFLAEGMLAGETCLLMAEGDILAAYLDRFREVPGLDLEAAVAAGLLRVAASAGQTVAEGLAYWERACWTALERGQRRIRGVGEMVSERTIFGSEDEMFSYELALNLITKRFPCVVLCQYDARAFSGEALLHALRVHPDLFPLPSRALLA